jgi:hypothetical protein
MSLKCLDGMTKYFNFTKKKLKMKKLIILLQLMFMTIFGFSQMMFSDIELGLSYQEFKVKLQEKGFIYHYTYLETKNIFSYRGKFIGKDVGVGVKVTPTTKIVWRVDVELPELISWDTTKSEFFDLCKKLTQKYGPPNKKLTSFSEPYYEGDGNELLAICQDKCTYVYNWKTINGFVGIEIISHRQGTALMNIWYEDKKASAANSAEKDKIIINGL